MGSRFSSMQGLYSLVWTSHWAESPARFFQLMGYWKQRGRPEGKKIAKQFWKLRLFRNFADV